MPVAIGTVVDRMYALREKRLALQKEVEKLKQQELALKAQVIQRLSKSEAEQVGGKQATASITHPVIGIFVDWQRFWQQTRLERNMDLLPRSMAQAAWKQRYESGVLVPGTEAMRQDKLNLRKRGGRKVL